MWAELIFSRDDLARLLEEALPLVIRLDEGGKEHSLSLTSLSEVTLVADTGLRVSCKAQVHWPVMGIEVPVTIHALTILLLPTIGRTPEGDKLVFRGSIEKADFAGLPGIIDHTITAAINARLGGSDTELAWNFTEALTYDAPLPAMLSPLASFAIKPAWGKVRITDEAIVYAASFHSALVRQGNAIPEELLSAKPNDAPAHPDERPAAAGSVRPPKGDAKVDRYVALGVMGLAAGFAFLAVGGASASRRASSWR